MRKNTQSGLFFCGSRYRKNKGNYSVATVPRGVLTWICQNPETYKPKCHHRRWFTRATSQSPCLHGTLRSAAITIKTRKACFYRLNAFWLVTVKVLNSYFNLTFHCTDHRALCKVFLHERVYTENQNGLYRPQFGVVDIECSCKPVVSAIYCGIQSNYGDYRFT